LTIGLPNSGCDLELQIIKETEKAYQVQNDLNEVMWFPKSAFDDCGQLSEYGEKLYKEKHNANLENKQIEKEIDINYDNTKWMHFAKELNFIQNDEIREWTKKAINSLPDYIFHAAASSTGKYHPSYALGDGGLIRHMKAAMGIATELFRMKVYDFPADEKDIALAALSIHDGTKSGIIDNKWTKHEHPIIICDYLRQQNFFNDIPQAEQICECVACHMGQWATNSKSNVVLPEPQTELQKFVHLCDYLASRKCLEFNFNVM
jgi:hypothetical protein